MCVLENTLEKCCCHQGRNLSAVHPSVHALLRQNSLLGEIPGDVKTTATLAYTNFGLVMYDIKRKTIL